MSDIKEVVIVTDGKKSSRFQYLELIRKSKFLICTDGAIKWLLKHNLEPDVVIGDLDSIESSVPLSSFVEYDGNQENSDLEKAILYALKHGYNSAIVLFAVGKRDDHTLSNMYILYKYIQKISLTMVTDYFVIKPVIDFETFCTKIGQIISILPIGNDCRVTTTGLKYPLRDETLEIGSRGISNKAISNSVTVSVKSGTVLLFLENAYKKKKV